MKVSHCKWILLTAAAVGVPCLVLAENSAGPAAAPAVVSAQSDVTATAIVAADKEPGAPDGPGHGPKEGMRGPKGPKLEKGTYLGIGTGPVSEEVRAQLKLPAGTGLTIREVAADSPAEKAGLKKFDVLTKVDDQLIIDEHQLVVLVRMHKAGDEVKLSVVHESAPTTVSAALVEKDLPPIGGEGMGGPGGGARGGPGGRGGFGRGMMMGRMGGMMGGIFRRGGMGGPQRGGPGIGGPGMRGGGMGGPEQRGPGGPGMGGPGMRGRGMGGLGMGGPGMGRPEMGGPGMGGREMGDPGMRPMRGGPGGNDQQGPGEGRGFGMQRGPQGGPDGGPQGGPAGGPDNQNGPGGPGGAGPGAGGPPQGGPEQGGGAFMFRGRGMRGMAGPTTMPANFESTVSFTDGDQTITMHTKDSHRTLSVKDKDGKSVFDGPIDTTEERAKIPADVSSKLKAMRGGMTPRGGPGAEGETPDMGGPAPVADNQESPDDMIERLQQRREAELANVGNDLQDQADASVPPPPVR